MEIVVLVLCDVGVFDCGIVDCDVVCCNFEFLMVYDVGEGWVGWYWDDEFVVGF